jgi:AAA family ATP:ADP antiporter
VGEGLPGESRWRRAVRLVADVRRGEWPLALGFAAFFFLVITTFWIMKPLRTSQFLGALGAKHLPWARFVTAALVLPVGALVGHLSARIPHRRLVLGATLLFGLGHLAFWAVEPFAEPAAVHVPFYFYVDVYVTTSVALFWAYLHEHMRAEDATRLYGIVGAGGLLGGIVGSTLSGFLATVLHGRHLLLLTAGTTAATFPVLLALGRMLERRRAAPAAPADRPSLRTAWDGAAMVFSSRYLLLILALVAFYEISSVVADYQFSTHVMDAFPGEGMADQRTAWLGRFSMVAGLIGLAIQLLATSALQRRAGLGAALAVLPLAMLGGASLFLILPGLAGVSLWFGADASLNYGIYQTSKEVLYTPTDASVKYRAKAFIDVFGVRFAKAAGAGLVYLLLLAAASATAMAVAAIAVIALWLPVVRAAGRAFARRGRRPPDSPAAVATPVAATRLPA